MTKPDIEASYALSPMQEGMLFHSLYGPHSGVYVQQMVGELREALDVSAFRLAWERIVERHGILRTSFCLGYQEEPLQTVHQYVVYRLRSMTGRSCQVRSKNRVCRTTWRLIADGGLI